MRRPREGVRPIPAVPDSPKQGDLWSVSAHVRQRIHGRFSSVLATSKNGDAFGRRVCVDRIEKGARGSSQILPVAREQELRVVETRRPRTDLEGPGETHVTDARGSPRLGERSGRPGSRSWRRSSRAGRTRGSVSGLWEFVGDRPHPLVAAAKEAVCRARAEGEREGSGEVAPRWRPSQPGVGWT